MTTGEKSLSPRRHNTNCAEPQRSKNVKELFYATGSHKRELILFLLEKGTNPFVIDKYGNSPFSIALSQTNIELAKIFIASQKFKNNQLIKQLLDEDEITFCCTIASKICSNDNSLRNIFGLDELGANVCFAQARDSYEILSEGEDSGFLLDDNIFLA